MAVNLNVFPPLAVQQSQGQVVGQQGQAGFVTGSGATAVNANSNLNQNQRGNINAFRAGIDVNPPLAPPGWDCFDKGCTEADFRCNRVLPGAAVYNPCIGKWINPYNTFPYLHVVDFPGGYGGNCGRRGRCRRWC